MYMQDLSHEIQFYPIEKSFIHIPQIYLCILSIQLHTYPTKISISDIRLRIRPYPPSDAKPACQPRPVAMCSTRACKAALIMCCTWIYSGYTIIYRDTQYIYHDIPLCTMYDIVCISTSETNLF